LQFLFDDVFHGFRLFFNTHKFQKDSKFLYDIAFGLTPFLFDIGDPNNGATATSPLIYDEEDEVTHMYFIQEGSVGIGYYAYT
jgi:hypothetical protein